MVNGTWCRWCCRSGRGPTWGTRRATWWWSRSWSSGSGRARSAQYDQLCHVHNLRNVCDVTVLCWHARQISGWLLLCEESRLSFILRIIHDLYLQIPFNINISQEEFQSRSEYLRYIYAVSKLYLQYIYATSTVYLHHIYWPCPRGGRAPSAGWCWPRRAGWQWAARCSRRGSSAAGPSTAATLHIVQGVVHFTFYRVSSIFPVILNILWTRYIMD